MLFQLLEFKTFKDFAGRKSISSILFIARTMRNFTLNTGAEMPALSIGTWQHNDTGNQMRDAVVQAVEMGYRYIDTTSAVLKLYSRKQWVQ